MKITRAQLGLLFLCTAAFPTRAAANPPQQATPARLEFAPYEGAVLERLARNSFDDWVRVCSERCDIALDDETRHARYRIRDSSGATSHSFFISVAAGQRIVLTAHPGSPKAHEAGVVTTTLGTLGLIGSVGDLVATFIDGMAKSRTDPDYTNGGYYHPDPSPSMVPPVLAFGASLMVTTVGIALLVSSHPSASRSFGTVEAALVRRPTFEGSVAPSFPPPLFGAREQGPTLPAPTLLTFAKVRF